jgi:hypothetical protein
MPVVRRLQKQVDLNPLRGGERRAAETFESQGGTIAQAKAQGAALVGDAATRLANTATGLATDIYSAVVEKERQAANQTAFLAAKNRLSTFRRNTLAPALTTEGAAAMSVPDTISAELTKTSDEILANLNVEQKRMFEPVLAQERDSILLDVQQHVLTQRKKLQANEAESAIANSLERAGQLALQPVGARFYIDQALQTLAENADAFGLGPEELRKKRLGITSAGHEVVVQGLINAHQPEAAQDWLTGHKAEIDQKTYDALNRGVETADVRVQGQRVRDEAVARFPGDVAAQRKYAMDKLDGEAESVALAGIEHEATVADTIKNKAQADAFDAAWKWVAGGRSWTTIAPATWSQLEGRQQDAIKERASKGPVVVMGAAGYAEYLRLMDLASRDPKAFVAMKPQDVLALRRVLDDSHYEHVVSTRTRLSDSMLDAAMSAVAKEEAKGDLAAFSSREEVFKGVLTGYQFTPNEIALNESAGEDRRAIVAHVRRVMEDEEDAYTKEHGKKMPVQEFRNSLTRVMQGLKTQTFTDVGYVWDSENPLLEMTPDDIPPADLHKVDAALQSIKMAVTPDTRLAMWWSAKLGLSLAKTSKLVLGGKQ